MIAEPPDDFRKYTHTVPKPDKRVEVLAKKLYFAAGYEVWEALPQHHAEYRMQAQALIDSGVMDEIDIHGVSSIGTVMVSRPDLRQHNAAVKGWVG